MLTRWRGRSAVLAITLVAVVASASSVAGGDGRRALRVSTPDGRTLAVVPLADDASFRLRYRNSLYGTIAEERFRVAADGRILLTSLEAEQLAVLEEYYGATAPRPGTALRWRATPSHVPIIDTLRVAATDRGERTLLVAGTVPVALWRSVDDHAPTVILEVSR